MELVKRASTGLPGLFICPKEPETWIFMGTSSIFQKPVRTEQACLRVVLSERELTRTFLQVCPHTSSSPCSTPSCWLPKALPFSPGGVCHPHCKLSGVSSALEWPEPKALGLREGRVSGALSTERLCIQDCHPSLLPRRAREGEEQGSSATK